MMILVFTVISSDSNLNVRKILVLSEVLSLLNILQKKKKSKTFTTKPVLNNDQWQSNSSTHLITNSLTGVRSAVGRK